MAELKVTAIELVRSLDKAAKLLETYLADATAFATKHGRNSTEGGMSGMQLRRILKALVLSKLSPKPVFGQPDPPLQLDGAPEARKYIEGRPLPGLA